MLLLCIFIIYHHFSFFNKSYNQHNLRDRFCFLFFKYTDFNFVLMHKCTYLICNLELVQKLKFFLFVLYHNVSLIKKKIEFPVGSALTYHVEFRVTSVWALAWGPFLILFPSPFASYLYSTVLSNTGLKCPKFQISKKIFLDSDLEPHYISHHQHCFLDIGIAKPISIKYYWGDKKAAPLWKETWRTIRMYLYWHQMHMTAVLKHHIHLSHFISLQRQFNFLLDVC